LTSPQTSTKAPKAEKFVWRDAQDACGHGPDASAHPARMVEVCADARNSTRGRRDILPGGRVLYRTSRCSAVIDQSPSPDTSCQQHSSVSCVRREMLQFGGTIDMVQIARLFWSTVGSRLDGVVSRHLCLGRENSTADVSSRSTCLISRITTTHWRGCIAFSTTCWVLLAYSLNQIAFSRSFLH
jgi:hypothetical protein